MARAPLDENVIVGAAAGLADTAGLAAVTLSEVARTLSVRTPSLYGHVRDLAALRDGLTILALGELADRVGEAIAGRAGLDALRGLCEAHRGYAREHPGRWEALQRRAGAAVVRSDAAVHAGRGMLAVLRGYDIAEGDQVHAVRVVAAAINGFVELEHVGSFAHSEPPADDSWDVLILQLDALLRRWNRTTAGGAA